MHYEATVSKKGLMTLPSKLRRKLSITEGSKVKLVEHDGYVILVPAIPFQDLYGIGQRYSIALRKVVLELEREHNEEAQM